MYCSENDYEANTCDLCYRWDWSPVDAFTPNQAINDYENKCTIPDCLENIPGTQQCLSCNWFNYEQLSLDLADSNPDNDFLSIPYLDDEFFYDEYKFELIPMNVFHEPIDNQCVQDC